LDFLVPHATELPPLVEHLLNSLKQHFAAGIDATQIFPLNHDPLKTVQNYPLMAQITLALKEDDPFTLASLLIAFLAFLPDSLCTNRLLAGFVHSLGP